METTIRENCWPARKLILFAIVWGYILVVGVMAYMYHTGAVGRLAPPLLVSAAGMAVCFALLFFAITLVIRPSGDWTVNEQGLHFVSSSGNIEQQISWPAINRMKSTSVSLVIWWTEAPETPTDTPQPRRSVLFVDPEQARDLIATWHSQTREPSAVRGS